MLLAEVQSPKVKKDDRILVLRPKAGAKALDTYGNIDTRLFTGDNVLHALKGPTSLWSFKYDKGGLPSPLQGTYTTFDRACAEAKRYFDSRNVEIVEIID